MRAMADRLDISQRKKDHLALCAGDNVNFREKTSLFEQVELIHNALPEMHADAVDSHIDLLGKRLAAPIIVAAMTGGTDEAAQINQDLARAANTLGLGFGLGSQRAMFVRPHTAWTFKVREQAPDVLLLGNLGLVQARTMSSAQIIELCRETGSDALCIHLNPAMEIVQPGGDRDFSSGLDTIRRLVAELPIPIVVKETGCGLSRGVASLIKACGVHHVDVSGSGGTSWVAVEAHRAVDETERLLADELWDWGIPTAASLVQLQGLGLQAIATGGVRSGTDIAKALALGAVAGGLAAPVLKAHRAGGYDGALAFLQRLIHTVRSIMLLTGSRDVAAMQRAPRILGPALARWVP
ncbi:MAG: type 2 isopentenyl-diphosphate Delta-isomerase [Nannocystis sp.]|nr:type 2 isopentenyl-diphosphate Delta-isomerase [Nannocystis sp.]